MKLTFSTLSLILVFLLGGCTSSNNRIYEPNTSVSTGKPKIVNITYNYREVFITLNKIPSGTAFLQDKSKRYRTRSTSIDGNTIVFNPTYFWENTCLLLVFETKFLRYALTPKGRSYSGDWCFENDIRNEYVKLAPSEGRALFYAKKEQEKLSALKAQASNFSNECRFPKPPVTPPPAPFCSNQNVVSEKRLQCWAPTIKKVCKVGLPIIMNIKPNRNQKRALVPACVLLVDYVLDKNTTASDLVNAQFKAELISMTGSAKEIISWGIALAGTGICHSHITAVCNPSPPAPPACLEWKKYSAEVHKFSNKVDTIMNVRKSNGDLLKQIKQKSKTINF